MKKQVLLAWLYVVVAFVDLSVLALLYIPPLVGVGIRWIPGVDSGLPLLAERMLWASSAMTLLATFQAMRAFLFQRVIFKYSFWVMAIYSVVGLTGYSLLKMGFV